MAMYKNASMRLIPSRPTRAKLLASLSFFTLYLMVGEGAADAQTSYYQSKTLRVIVGTSGGGGYDRAPREMFSATCSRSSSS